LALKVALRPAAKGEQQAALEEYRRASELDPEDKDFHMNYVRLSKKLKK